MSAVVLQTRDLVRKFGGFIATDHVNLAVEAGARHALIGPNGAGKTTLINLLTGYLEPSAGRVELLGEDVTTMAQHERCRRGLVRTFQINQLFADMTVLESVALAVSEQGGLGTHWWKPLAGHGEVEFARRAIAHAELQRVGAGIHRGCVRGAEQTSDENLFSYRFGAVFHPVENVSLYAAYGNAKTPSSATVRAGCGLPAAAPGAEAPRRRVA